MLVSPVEYSIFKSVASKQLYRQTHSFKLQYVTMMEGVSKKVEKFPVVYFITKRTFIYICF